MGWNYAGPPNRPVRSSSLRTALMKKLKRFGVRMGKGAWIEQLRPGWSQRASGAWVWTLRDPDGQDAVIGSGAPMKECARARRLMVGSRGDVDPE